MFKKSGNGYVLVICDAVYNVNTGRKGLNGAEIIVDVAYDPQKYAFNHATVYKLPVSMGHAIIAQIPSGVPGYGPINRPPESEIPYSTDLYKVGGVNKYKYSSDIEPDVREGDNIYFKQRTLSNIANFMGMLKDESGKPKKYIYKVPYENIFCYIRDEKIGMIGSWVLVEPIMEDYEEIMEPTFYPYTDTLGKKIPRPKSEWIQKKIAPEHDNLRGVVVHIGKPLKGDHCDIRNGMMVVFKKQATTFFQVIENKKYIVMSQDNILCELIENVKVV